MSDTPKGSREKMDALDAVRELAQDHDSAIALIALMSAEFDAHDLGEICQIVRAWQFARDRILPHKGPNGEWVDRQDRPGPSENPPWLHAD